MSIQVQLPVGRIVWGNPGKSQQKRDQKTRAPILKDGKPIDQWAFGVAIPKEEFKSAVWPAMANEAKTLFPSGVPPQFSWKYKDGDGTDRQGKPYNAREGYAGHYVLNINTEAFAPPIYKLGPNGQYVQLKPEEIKCGDYVAMVVNLQANKPQDIQHTPGLYVNPVAILHVGYGREIINTVDPATLFGATPQFALPAGASATPIASPNAVGMPGTQPMQPGYTPPPNPAFTGMSPQPQMPGQPPQPGYSVGMPLVQPGQPPQMPGMAQPYTPPGPAPMMPGQPPQPYGQPPGYTPPPAHDFVQNAGYQAPQMPGQAQPPMQPVWNGTVWIDPRTGQALAPNR